MYIYIYICIHTFVHYLCAATHCYMFPRKHPEHNN